MLDGNVPNCRTNCIREARRGSSKPDIQPLSKQVSRVKEPIKAEIPGNALKTESSGANG